MIERKNFSLNDFRVFEKPVIEKGSPFLSSREVFEYFNLVSRSDREMFVCFFLDAKNHLIQDEIHSIGTVDTSAVYPREIFKSALLYGASSIICIHNHPSGDPDPSVHDTEITKNIVWGGHLLGIKILDHIIVGDNDRYYSYGDQGLMEEFDLNLKQITNSI